MFFYGNLKMYVCGENEEYKDWAFAKKWVRIHDSRIKQFFHVLEVLQSSPAQPTSDPVQHGPNEFLSSLSTRYVSQQPIQVCIVI
jgi:hypothetical protein